MTSRAQWVLQIVPRHASVLIARAPHARGYQLFYAPRTVHERSNLDVNSFMPLERSTNVRTPLPPLSFPQDPHAAFTGAGQHLKADPRLVKKGALAQAVENTFKERQIQAALEESKARKARVRALMWPTTPTPTVRVFSHFFFSKFSHFFFSKKSI
jgi:hypothetical protein